MFFPMFQRRIDSVHRAMYKGGKQKNCRLFNLQFFVIKEKSKAKKIRLREPDFSFS